MPTKWFYKRDDQSIQGPFTAKKLKEMASSGQILPTDTVRRETAEKMITARRVKGERQLRWPIRFILR